MSTLNSRLQLSIVNRKKSKNIVEKGFTLVELMIVIVVVGVLSSVALPNFLSTKSKAEAGALTGSLIGFAKECASEQLTGGGSLTQTIVGNAGGTLSGTCTGTADRTIKNTDPYDEGKIAGLTCGRTTAGAVAKAGATDKYCTFNITTDGVITGAWSAS